MCINENVEEGWKERMESRSLNSIVVKMVEYDDVVVVHSFIPISYEQKKME